MVAIILPKYNMPPVTDIKSDERLARLKAAMTALSPQRINAITADEMIRLKTDPDVQAWKKQPYRIAAMHPVWKKYETYAEFVQADRVYYQDNFMNFHKPFEVFDPYPGTDYDLEWQMPNWWCVHQPNLMFDRGIMRSMGYDPETGICLPREQNK